jgi:hypothetical protein
VDNKSALAKQAGVTPGKLVLIGVLAFVFGGVLYIQFGPTTESASTSAPRPTAAAKSTNSPAATAVVVSPASTAPRKITGALANWRLPDLTAVVEYDPFALPASFPQPRRVDDETAIAENDSRTKDAAELAALEAERTKSKAELQRLRQQGVRVIIVKKDKFVAIVGDQEVHVGDQIDGFTVIAIDADGVRVAKDLTP